MDNILILTDITKKFGGLTALDGISMNIQQGLLNMLIGPNGSGKTTFINCATGFYQPENGQIWFKDTEITGLSPHRIYELGLVRTFQIPQPFRNLTILENFLTAYRGNPGESFFKAPLKKAWRSTEETATERAFQFLKLLDLDHMWDRPATHLSGGQMKLVEAGRAIMSGAQMILMDEPAAGLFPKLAHEVFHYLTEMRDQLGVTFLIVEHRLDLVLPYIDYAYCLARGRLISEGTPKKVLSDEVVIDSYLGA